MVTKILFQGITPETHLAAVRDVLMINDPQDIIFSTAFMNQGGLLQIKDALEPVAAKTTIIAGIRNGITSAQGLVTALNFGCTVLVVDTGSRNVIFHPKYTIREAQLKHELYWVALTLRLADLILTSRQVWLWHLISTRKIMQI